MLHQAFHNVGSDVDEKQIQEKNDRSSATKNGSGCSGKYAKNRKIPQIFSCLLLLLLLAGLFCRSVAAKICDQSICITFITSRDGQFQRNSDSFGIQRFGQRSISAGCKKTDERDECRKKPSSKSIITQILTQGKGEIKSMCMTDRIEKEPPVASIK
jgi:hypothetical protein